MQVEAKQVLKLAALTCATKHFEGSLREGMALLIAMLQKFSINTNSKKLNTMLAEMPRARVTQGISISSEELGI